LASDAVARADEYKAMMAVKQPGSAPLHSKMEMRSEDGSSDAESAPAV